MYFRNKSMKFSTVNKFFNNIYIFTQPFWHHDHMTEEKHDFLKVNILAFLLLNKGK